MTKSERRGLMREIIKGQGEYVAGRIKLLTGRTSADAKALEDENLNAEPEAW